MFCEDHMKHLDYSQQETWREAGDTPLQSPIAINSEHTQPVIKSSDLVIAFNGQTQYDDRIVGEQFLVSGELMITGERWSLERFHFHDGAEHTVDGIRHDVEIHFVYRREGRILVLAVFGDVSNEPIDTHIQDVFLDTIDAKILANWLPKSHSYYSYIGSLTTPPLGQGVTWVILKETIPVGKDDLSVIHEHYPNNYRNVQDIAGRDVLSVRVTE